MYNNTLKNVLEYEWAKCGIICFYTLIRHQFHILAVVYHFYFPTENISDQSNIESRIKALKEELRKRKLMAYQLKKEQKKRHKERLKAQEASLLKQLQVNVQQL